MKEFDLTRLKAWIYLAWTTKPKWLEREKEEGPDQIAMAPFTNAAEDLTDRPTKMLLIKFMEKRRYNMAAN